VTNRRRHPADRTVTTTEIVNRKGPVVMWLWWLLAATPVVVVSPLLDLAGREFAYAALAFGSMTAVLAGIRRNRPARPLGWRLIAAGMGCMSVASLIWGCQFAFVSTAQPAPGIGDLLSVAMYPLIGVGMVRLVQRRPGGSGWTEAGIVTSTGVVLAWVGLFDPFLNDTGRWVAMPTISAYPVLDLLLVACVTLLLSTQRGLSRGQLLLLAATLVLTAADSAFFISVAEGGVWSGPPISVALWSATFVLVGAAALHPGQMAPAAGAHRRPFLLHLVVVLIGPAATLWAVLTDAAEGELDAFDYLVPFVASTCIAILLVVRMTNAVDVAARHAASLRHSATHDSLTGLPNRRRLEDLLLDGPHGALILLDLDGFKDVNDRLGHAFGDDLLLAVADRLRKLLGPGEVLARPGGDEFGVLLSTDAREVTTRAATLLAALRNPVPVGDHALHVTGSAGIRAIEPGVTAAQLLADADLALYAAKAAGKDCAVLYDPALRLAQAERVRTVERLRDALAADEFAVHYQPIVSLGDGTPVAVEALVRWLPPGQAPIGPDNFIPAAEDSGLIVPLGEWVLRRACTEAAAWHRAYGTTLTVNVSPRQLTDPTFTSRVRRALADSGLPATALTLEITEGVLVRSGTHALGHLSALRAEGVRVAIDDFGTGYSSLAYLRDLPIDVLKIDRSFMPADSADTRQASLVRAVVDLARSLNLTTVAEGIETVYHADLLRELGCDRGQGYLFARPAAAGDISARLDEVLVEVLDEALDEVEYAYSTGGR
jgi:diguanylate cyclase (GGDEF)-like protein